MLGKEGARAVDLQRALEAYRRSGNLRRQAALLSNLGVICHWEGRWDDAMSYLRARPRRSPRSSATRSTPRSRRMNLAEILSRPRRARRGRGDCCSKTLPVWKASRYRYLLGGCLWLLGRVSLRGNRIDEALARFAEARRC